MRRIIRKILFWNRARLVRNKYVSIFNRFENFTMIPSEIYFTNLELTKRFSSAQGSIVECGTWKGGMIGGMACLLGTERTYYLFDSFEGLPPAKEIDGDSALHWQANTSSPDYFDNCTAAEGDARNAMHLAGIENAVIEKGWFEDTLQNVEISDGIAILRMDADWYDSTLEILNRLFKSVNKGGVIIIDDYYMWDGCSKAVHDFLSKNQCVERIRMHKGVCFIEKE